VSNNDPEKEEDTKPTNGKTKASERLRLGMASDDRNSGICGNGVVSEPTAGEGGLSKVASVQ